jgi:hypothetical protein
MSRKPSPSVPIDRVPLGPDPRTSLVVGHCYLMESVTSNLYVGRLVSIDGPHDVVLSGASWVSETGKKSSFMQNGKAEGMEIEPYGLDGRGGYKAVHWAGWEPWPHPLFTEAV